jgi:5-formyltetrahydrofolate cyclo-ligase
VLVEQGCHVAFPRVVARDAGLEFHRVPDGEVLQPGAFGVHEPLAHWPLVIPDILLVPLLAFDVHGTRLGYGGGFYDRTLSQLRVRAIGIAYASQQMELLPRDGHDYPLDAVLTENGLHQISGTSR